MEHLLLLIRVERLPLLLAGLERLPLLYLGTLRFWDLQQRVLEALAR